MSRIGIYAGTFDPVHTGHLAFADEAIRQHDLQNIIFIPEAKPRQKPHVSALDKRVQALKKAFKDQRYSVLKLSQEQVDTKALLLELQEKYPDDVFVFLIGSDVAVNSLTYWSDLELLLPYFFIVGMRSTEKPSEVSEVMERLGLSYGLLETEHISVSSTSIRNSFLG